MKILFVGGALAGGGAERVTAILAEHFYARGECVSIACDTGIVPEYAINNGINLINHREGCFDTFLRRRFALFRFIHMLRNIRKIEKRVKPDVVISYLTTFNVYTIFALWGRKVPIVAMEHTTVTFDPPKREKITRDILYSRAAAITVLTKSDYEIWKNRFGGNVVYMPNPSEKVGATIENTTREKNVLAVGRVTDWHLKGFDTLVKCWATISNDFPEWRLDIAGNTDEKSIDYLSSILKENQGINLNFLGFRRDIYQLMNKSSVFALASRREGLPMALIEAMSAGCCCVAFNVKTGPSDIITNGVDGLVVKNQDEKAMINALRDVLSDERKRSSFAKMAPKGVQRYSVETIIDGWYQLFKELGVINK